LSELFAARASARPPRNTIQFMNPAWLKRKLTVAEAEAEHMVTIEAEDKKPAEIPFGYCNQSWVELLAAMNEGDEIWSFSSSDNSWQHLAGREGVALLRNGQVVTAIITCMS
jgi:hypothetical protein